MIKQKLNYLAGNMKTTTITDNVYKQLYVWVHAKSSKEFNNYMRSIVDQYDVIVDTSDEEENDGETLDLLIDGRLVIYFWFNVKDATAIVHELAHATFKSLRSRGVILSAESEESYCYLLSFLYEEVLKELYTKKPLTKHKKVL
jgi:hypothetical protein